MHPDHFCRAGAGFVFFIMLSVFPVMQAPGAGNMLPDNAMPDIFPADEVKTGMRGVGYTSFHGDELQEFGFEVLGALRSFHPQGRVFLVHLEHPLLEESGVIAGMSGSPLFIDGRLMGAVAYGFRNSIRPIAGVTPACEMLIPLEMESAGHVVGAVSDAKTLAREYILQNAGRVSERHADGRQGAESLMFEMMELFISAHWRPGGDRFQFGDYGAQAPDAGAGLPDSPLQMLPVPLCFSGVDISGLSDLEPVMRSGGLLAVQAPPGEHTAPFDLESALKPGKPAGVVLMRGDIDIAGMGTLTFFDGERVTAFGHPLTGAGKTDLPLAAGHVETVIPSRSMSFRLTSSRDIIGSVTQDRQSAIVGVIGRRAPMFPAVVEIRGAHDATYRYELAGHWQFAPLMSLYAAALSALRWEGMDEMMTVEASARITLKGRERPIVLENIYSGFNPVRPAFELVMLPMQSLMLNRFEDVIIESLDVDFSVEKGLRSAAIEAVQLERNEIRAGDTLRLWVTLRPFHGPAQVKEITLDIPRDAKPGRVAAISVTNAAEIMALSFDKDPGLLRPVSLEGLIEALEVMPRNTRLFVRGDFFRKGLRYDQEPLPSLPGSVMHMLEYGTMSGKTAPLLEDVQNSVETPWVIGGRRTVYVRIIE